MVEVRNTVTDSKLKQNVFYAHRETVSETFPTT